MSWAPCSMSWSPPVETKGATLLPGVDRLLRPTHPWLPRSLQADPVSMPCCKPGLGGRGHCPLHFLTQGTKPGDCSAPPSMSVPQTSALLLPLSGVGTRDSTGQSAGGQLWAVRGQLCQHCQGLRFPSPWLSHSSLPAWEEAATPGAQVGLASRSTGLEAWRHLGRKLGTCCPPVESSHSALGLQPRSLLGSLLHSLNPGCRGCGRRAVCA